MDIYKCHSDGCIKNALQGIRFDLAQLDIFWVKGNGLSTGTTLPIPITALFCVRRDKIALRVSEKSEIQTNLLSYRGYLES